MKYLKLEMNSDHCAGIHPCDMLLLSPSQQTQALQLATQLVSPFSSASESIEQSIVNYPSQRKLRSGPRMNNFNYFLNLLVSVFKTAGTEGIGGHLNYKQSQIIFWIQ